jgi:hypothetical protein
MDWTDTGTLEARQDQGVQVVLVDSGMLNELLCILSDLEWFGSPALFPSTLRVARLGCAAP